MQLELFDKEDWQVLLEAEQYFNYLQKPNEAFSNMPVCPFLKAELEKDNPVSYTHLTLPTTEAV